MKTERLKAELTKAREKSAQWQARVREIERKITEQENLEILRAVRDVVSSPKELRALLKHIQAVEQPSNLNEEELHEN
ncbi:MAG: DUF4315 family protein [Oscillibacter sp.]|jgi:flagellar basal body rod protein FlgF|nr:DUF4315 family protein [Oscillibacter sp.]